MCCLYTHTADGVVKAHTTVYIRRTEVMVLYVIGLHRQCGAVSVLCYYSVGIENGESAHTQ